MELFENPKIIYPEITKYMPFYYDNEENFYPNNKAFIITSEDENLPALTAQLNSSLFRYCFKDNFPDLMGNTYELRKIFFDKIPLKRPSPEQARVLEVLVGWVQRAKRYGKDLEQEMELLDVLVLEMYFEAQFQAAGLSLFEAMSIVLNEAKIKNTLDIALDSLFHTHSVVNMHLKSAISSIEVVQLITGKVSGYSED